MDATSTISVRPEEFACLLTAAELESLRRELDRLQVIRDRDIP